MTAACSLDGLSGAERLKRYTDIDVIGTNVVVKAYDHKDLDQAAYDILITKEQQSVFDHALETAGGKECIVYGCHYKSKAGHNVFVNKIGLAKYTIYTSG